MSEDMEENGIQVLNVKVIMNSEIGEKIGIRQEAMEKFTAVDDGSEDDLSNTIMSELLSPSPKGIPSDHAKESPGLTQHMLEEHPASQTVPPRLSDILVTPEIDLPDLPDLPSLPTGVTEVFRNLGAMVNSTMSSTDSSNISLTKVNRSSAAWSFEEIGAVTIVSVMVPFILISNLFVIMSVIRFRRLHTPTNYFITSLAVVDIFVALATPFMVVIEVFHFGDAAGPEDVVLCLLPNRVLMMTCGVSILTLAAIAYDRHTALVSPLEYVNIMTSRKVAIMVSLIWIYSALIVWIPVMAGWYHVPTDTAPCSANLIFGRAPVLFLSAIFVPSCVAILVCYFRIFMVARHHAKAIAAVEFAVHRRIQVKFMIKDTKYAKTLALVIGVFLILWLPYLLCIFIKVITSRRFDLWVQIYLILLAVFNSGINPWIYAFKNNELKAAFKRLYKEFCRDKFCKPNDRRSSLVSTISTTPRLSRTDSRMVSIVPEITVDTVSDKLKRSLDSLEESESEIEQGIASCDLQERRQTIAGAILPTTASHFSQKTARRQAASCSNLDSVADVVLDKADSFRMSRSFSLDFILPNQSDDCDLSDSGIFHDTSVHEDDCNTPLSLEHLPGTLNDKSSSVNSETTFYLSSPPTSCLSSFSQTSLSLPSSPVHVQLSPSFSSSKHSPAPHTHTLPARTHNHAAHSGQLLSPSALHATASLPSQHHLKHTHSFCYINEALQPDMCNSRRHYSAESSSAIHPYFEQIHVPVHCTDQPDTVSSHTIHQHMLSHTHSCPTFEPMSSFHSLLPYILDDGVDCSDQGELTTLTPLDNEAEVGFVNRVKNEGEFSYNRYLL